MTTFIEYQVIGRHLPTGDVPNPKLYRMRIFAPNEVVAKSRFWYYLRQLHKVKKASGEIVACNVVRRRILQHTLSLMSIPIDLRKEASQGQELWYLDSLRLPIGYTQHVQGVPRALSCGCRQVALPGYGSQAPCSIQVYPGSCPFFLSLPAPPLFFILTAANTKTDHAMLVLLLVYRFCACKRLKRQTMSSDHISANF